MADPHRVDAILRGLDPAMVVVTVAADGEQDGCLVGFHSQSSITPCRYVVWLSVLNRTYRLAEQAGHLGVHALTAADHDLAAHFGGTTGDEVDKLADVAWTPGPEGVPLLDRVPARFVGRVVEWLRPSDSDHLGVVLEPVEVASVESSFTDPFRLHHARDISPGHPA